MLNILTLHWNYLDGLKRLYESLLPALEGIDWRYFVKDNGSTDGSVEFLQSIKSDNIIPYFTGHNRHNFAEGMNIIFAQAYPFPDDYILLLNNDLWIENPKSIKNMIKLMEEDKDIGVVGAKILYPDKKTITHAGVIGSMRYNGLPFHYRRGEEVSKEDGFNREFQIVTGAAMLTKAKYFPMDETLSWAFDDCDLCLNVKYNHNKRIVYCGDTLFCHEESRSLKKNPVHKLMLQHNVSRFREKWEKHFKMDLEQYENNPNYMKYGHFVKHG